VLSRQAETGHEQAFEAVLRRLPDKVRRPQLERDTARSCAQTLTRRRRKLGDDTGNSAAPHLHFRLIGSAGPAACDRRDRASHPGSTLSPHTRWHVLYQEDSDELAPCPHRP
jgi:hypothetical protein